MTASLPGVYPEVTFNVNSQEIPLQPPPSGFCCAAKTIRGPQKSDLSQENYLDGKIPKGAFEQFGCQNKVKISGVIEQSS